MTNTYESVKKRLIDLLNNDNYKVIALKGKWGTGKTCLWRDINTEQKQESIYVSLFGAKTINDLKLRILQNTCLDDASSVKKLLNTGGGVVSQVLKRFTGYSAEDGVLLWLPELVKNKLIVIDDIERKHKALDIDELLGLLDEYSEIHKVRFLILLNSDKLTDDDIWASLREKVIDVEITLEPTATESFNIAAEGYTNHYLPEIKNAVEILNINNIRIIRKIIKMVEHIVKESGVADVPASNWIASTVLLTASHFRASDNLPSFEYIKSFNLFVSLMPNKEIQLTTQELGWRDLLRKLGINNSDEYESILQDYLETGLLDIDKLTSKFEEYKKNEIDNNIGEQLSEFFLNVYWNPDQSKSELIDKAKDLLPLVDKLNSYTITALMSTIEKQLDDTALAKQFLEAFLIVLDNQQGDQQIKAIGFGDEIHPEIATKLDEIENIKHPPLSLVETVERIIDNSGWGERERFALRHSTIQQYEDELKQIKNETLRRFLTQHIEWMGNPYDDDFKNGVNNFVAACANIYSSDPESRLSGIIYRMFDSKGISEKLTVS